MPPRHVPAALLSLVLLTTACPDGFAGDPAWYAVRPGDYLLHIARTFGTTVADLRRDNALGGDVIRPGQRLEIGAPFAAVADEPNWQRPHRHDGPLLADFGPYEQDRIIMPRTGVTLAQPAGAEVFAPADGVLRFAAPLQDLGVVVILEHPASYHTVLRPLDPTTIPWQPGQCVRRGDVLGRLAAPPDGSPQPYLHLELRHGGKAIHPDRLLR